MITCTDCGARNPDTAAWCSQCYASFGAAEAAVETAPEASTPEQSTPEQSTPEQSTTTDPSDTRVPVDDVSDAVDADSRERVRRTGPDRQDVEWRCVVCDAWNPLESLSCATCGAQVGTSLDAGRSPTRPRNVDPRIALVASAVLPGAGHALLGRTGGGLARAGTYLLWLVGGFLVLGSAAGAGQSVLPAVPLLIGAFALWVTTVNDVAVLSGALQSRELLTPRVFLWLVVAVVGGLVVSFLPAISRATGGG